MLSPAQQFYELSAKSERPLIALKQNFNGDALASALALAQAFKKNGKQPTVVAEPSSALTNFSFLPGIDGLKHDLKDAKKISIGLKLGADHGANISHSIINDEVILNISGLKTELSTDHIRLIGPTYEHDLIIALNTPDLFSLGKIYEDQPDFFYQAPIINIDSTPENEHFGHVNFVKLTAAAIAEIIYDLLEETADHLLDETVATCLLTGLIDKTRGFRASTVTPRTLQIAGKLMAAGADRGDIIRRLYQSKSVGILKIWGRLLQNMESDETQQLIWSQLTEADFLATGSRPDDLSGAIGELIATIPTVKYSTIFYQHENRHYCLIKTETKTDLRLILKDYSPYGDADTVTLIDPPEQTALLRKLAANV